MSLRAVLCIVLGAAALAAAQDCAGRNLDYCLSTRGCVWDDRTQMCGPTSCTSYNRYTACKADTAGVGPCEWEWTLQYCYRRDTPIPCDIYTQDCPQDRCVYDDSTGLCNAKNQPQPCYQLYEQQQCNAKSNCAWSTDVDRCLPKGEVPACSEMLDQALCEAATDNSGNKRCDYHTETEPPICWPKGLDVLCEVLSDTDCTSSQNSARCQLYRLEPQYQRCGSKTQPPPCIFFTDPSVCPTGRCAWDTICHEDGVDVDCSDLGQTGESSCPTDKCRYYLGVCHNLAEPVDCSSIPVASPECTSSVGCHADCDNQLCIKCPTGQTCVDSPCTGLTTPEFGDRCNGLLKSECEGNPDCLWDVIIDVCHNVNEPVSCYYYTSQGDCDTRKDCSWVNNECISCNNCDGPSTTASPDDGKPCKDHESKDCPIGRCEIYYDINTATETCIDGVCEDYYDVKSCNRAKPCKWSDSLYICYNSTTGIPCFEVFDQAMCNGANNCLWNSTYSRCEAKDTNKACETYDAGTCPQRCEYDYITHRCAARGCGSIYSEVECVAAGCDYTEGVCYKDNGGTCGSYKDSSTCPYNRCEFDFDANACIDLSCNSGIFDEQRCKDLKCDFNGIQCYSDTGNPCASYLKQGNCPANRCVFDYVGDKMVCTNQVCGDMISETSCTALAKECVWQVETYSCYNNTNVACALRSMRDCASPSCAYDFQYNKCRKKICTDLYDQVACQGSGSGLDCVWSDTYEVCYGKGDQIPCSVFSYTTQCPKSYCATVGELCYGKKDGVPCVQIVDSGLCAAQKTCIWDSTTYTCNFRNTRRDLEKPYTAIMLRREQARNPMMPGYTRAMAFHLHGVPHRPEEVRKLAAQQRDGIAAALSSASAAAAGAAHKQIARE